MSQTLKQCEYQDTIKQMESTNTAQFIPLSAFLQNISKNPHKTS